MLTTRVISFLLTAAILAPASARAGVLESLHRHMTVASTVPGNGDLNPYAVVVAPVSVGKIRKGDILVDNFNNQSNLQGTGTTIVIVNRATRSVSLFAKLPRNLPQCPGGIGLSTAMTMLSSGWVIVGSTPSIDGTTKTKGTGCLLVFDANGTLTAVWKGSHINDPWGNMAVIDRGATASLFISMSGFDVPGPDKVDARTGDPMIIKKAIVLRVDLAIAAGTPPKVTGQSVVASGFGQQADKDVFLIGPTGLALSGSTLYVSDAVENRIIAIPDALTRTDSAGTGRTVTKGGFLQRPLALAATPDGHILATNAKNGQAVEFDPGSGTQLGAQWIDTDQAQSPPGNGDLFGLAMALDGRSFYYVEDDVNTLVEAAP